MNWSTLTSNEWEILRRSRLAEITADGDDLVAYHVVRLNTVGNRFVVVETITPTDECRIGVTNTTWRDYADALDVAVEMAKT